MFEKVQVKGAQATPLYLDLARETGVQPGWNFHKYLIGRASKVKPDDPQLVAAIESELKAAAPGK